MHPDRSTGQTKDNPIYTTYKTAGSSMYIAVAVTQVSFSSSTIPLYENVTDLSHSIISDTKKHCTPSTIPWGYHRIVRDQEIAWSHCLSHSEIDVHLNYT
jgi:hypothetical protein